MVVKTKAEDGHDLWEGQKPRPDLWTYQLIAVAKKEGPEREIVKEKGKRSWGRQGQFQEEEAVNSMSYFREAIEVKSGNTYWVMQLLVLMESSYSGEVRLDQWEYAGSG